jgi:hypothetical protein
MKISLRNEYSLGFGTLLYPKLNKNKAKMFIKNIKFHFKRIVSNERGSSGRVVTVLIETKTKKRPKNTTNG